MAEKILNTRIALRIDTFENWTKADIDNQGANLVLKRGEIGLCEIASKEQGAQTAPTVLFKVGDGTSTFGQLNWASAKAADVYSWAKASDVTLDGKIIKFVGTDKEIDLSKFAIAEEVATDLATKADKTALEALDARVETAEGEIDTLQAADEGIIERLTLVENSLGLGSEGTGTEGVAEQLGALTTRVATAEGEIAELVAADATEKAAREAADTAITDSIGTVTEGKTVVEMIADAQSAAEGKVSELAEGTVKSNTDRIKAIEDDYLKAQDRSDLEAEISRVEGLVTTEKSRAEGIEAGLRADITNLQNNIASGLHFRGVVASTDEVLNPASGDICIIGTQEYICVVTEAEENGETVKTVHWEELGDADAHATKDELTTGLAGKVNTSDYNAKVAELAAEDTDIRADFAAADTALENKLTPLIEDKAAQSDLEELAGKVGDVEGDKTLAEQLAEVKATANAAAKASDVEAKVSEIETSLSEKALASDLTALTGRVATNEGNITTLQSKVSTLEALYTNDQVDKAISDAVAAEASLRSTADSELSGRIDAYDQRFGTADDILVFNCGSSTTVI